MLIVALLFVKYLAHLTMLFVLNCMFAGIASCVCIYCHSFTLVFILQCCRVYMSIMPKHICFLVMQEHVYALK